MVGRLLVVLLGGTMGCAVAIRGDDMPPADNYGFTYCHGNRPAAWVNANVIGTVDERGTVLHELKHAEQIKRFPNCRAYERWLATNGAVAEAEAFCEEVVLESAPPFLLTRTQAIHKYAGWMVRGYPQHALTMERAVRLLRAFCG